VWADRAGVDIVRARDGSDPAAVVFDAIAAGKSRRRDYVLTEEGERALDEWAAIMTERTRLIGEFDARYLRWKER